MDIDYVYADNAATTPLSTIAFEAMQPYLLNEYGNASTSYSLARSAKKALRESREIIANCIGSLPEEIYFTSGGTESNNWAIKGFALSHKSCHVVTSSIEHHAVLRSCEALQQLGYKVDYLDVDRFGIVSVETLKKKLKSSPTLVSIMLANNEIGTIQDIPALVDVAHRHGAIFHCDAVQAVGHIPVNVSMLGVDLLSASAHKFNGPKGTGFLYIRKGTEISSFMSGGSQEKQLRAGTENVAAIVGMAAALNENCDKLGVNTKKLQEISNVFINRLSLSGLDYKQNGAKDRLPGSISISIKGVEGEMLMHRLDLKKIYVSTGSACNSSEVELSHVIKAIGVPVDYAHGTIRITFGNKSSLNDALVIADAIAEICKGCLLSANL